MTQKALRNLLTRELYAYLGGPKVVLSDQVMPEAEYPYLYYQSVQQHIPGPYNQYDEGQAGADAFTQRRSEEAQASFSFTACSLDRDGPDGHRISGDDEALELADRAQGFFLFAGQRSLAARERRVQTAEQLRALLQDGQVRGEQGVEYIVKADLMERRCHFPGHRGAAGKAEFLAQSGADRGGHLDDDPLAGIGQCLPNRRQAVRLLERSRGTDHGALTAHGAGRGV